MENILVKINFKINIENLITLLVHLQVHIIIAYKTDLMLMCNIQITENIIKNIIQINLNGKEILLKILLIKINLYYNFKFTILYSS